MGAQVVDYRVSTLVVLCKDCGQDVGLYPARHKCAPIERPAMPALPTKYLDQKQQSRTPSLDSTSKTISSTSSISTSPSLSSAESSSKWSSRRGNKSPTTTTTTEEPEESIYLDNFTAHLPGSETSNSSGKKLWGKVRQNDKWKQLNEKNDKTKQTGKLWGKLLQATQNMAEKIPNRDEKGAESDEDDFDGETHVSRILREYYEKKRLPLPNWLFDDNTPMKRAPSLAASRQKSPTTSESSGPMRTPSRRRLWEQTPESENAMSSRERERQELRKNQSLRKPTSPIHDEFENNSRPDRARSLRGDRLNRARSARGDNDHYQEERYEPKRHEERYRENDYYREERSEDRYREDRYREDRYREDHYREDHYREERYNNDRPHYREEVPPSRSKSYRKEPLPPPPSRYDDRGYYDRPRSPPRHYKEPSRHYDDYKDADRYTDRNDLDDYYYDSAPRHQAPPPRERARREPSVRSGRYGKDAGYF
ncbi:hypothetical protein K501DRAFT_335870 [Backusella circina FSU 941]|nr:hypothetical protein K501DRAFT_335870 [Backusella circina FSU 941]